MPIRGSSRIVALIMTVTGGVGPTGSTGPTGPTGDYVTGPNGVKGSGITGIVYDGAVDGATFFIQGSTPVYLTGFRGNTGIGVTLDPPIIGYTGEGVTFVNISGYTLFFRSITFSDGISASISGNSIIIQDKVSYTGSFDPNELLYIDFANSTYFLDSAPTAKYKENVYSGITYANLNTVLRSSRDLFGIENFNYSTGSVQNLNHYGMTMTIDSAFYGITGTENNLKSGQWNTYIKFRSSNYDLNGLLGPTFSSINFSPLGPYTKKVAFDVQMGSCCYCDNCENTSFGRICVDYVLKEYCQGINGKWSSLPCYQRENSFDCYERRACCLNGTCINTSLQKCTQMGGEFCALKICGLNYQCGDECETTLAGVDEGTEFCCCCQDGVGNQFVCADESAIALCDEQGGVVISNNCVDGDRNNCCDQKKGGCCISNTCINDLTAIQCAEAGGIFLGEEINCSSNSCCGSS